MNKLYNDTAVQAIANAIRAKNGSSDTYTIAEMSTALNDISYYAKPIISNVPIATFEADGLPLNSLKVSVEAKQASGTPSPSNPLPISGWDAVVVTDVDDVDNPTVTQTTTISLPQTVYGGELDVVNGGMNKTDAIVDLGDLTWSYTNNIFYAILPTDSYKYIADAWSICSCYNYVGTVFSGTSDMQNKDDGSCALYYNPNYPTSRVIYIKDTRYTDTTTFTTAIAGQTFVYELATPTTLTTQPTPIKSLNGTNNLSVDCGEIIELEYFKEV